MRTVVPALRRHTSGVPTPCHRIELREWSRRRTAVADRPQRHSSYLTASSNSCLPSSRSLVSILGERLDLCTNGIFPLDDVRASGDYISGCAFIALSLDIVSWIIRLDSSGTSAAASRRARRAPMQRKYRSKTDCLSTPGHGGGCGKVCAGTSSAMHMDASCRRFGPRNARKVTKHSERSAEGSFVCAFRASLGFPVRRPGLQETHVWCTRGPIRFLAWTLLFRSMRRSKPRRSDIAARKSERTSRDGDQD